MQTHCTFETKVISLMHTQLHWITQIHVHYLCSAHNILHSRSIRDTTYYVCVSILHCIVKQHTACTTCMPTQNCVSRMAIT